MEKDLPIHLQEVVFSSSESRLNKQISRFVKAGVLVKIAPRIYTPNATDAPEKIIRRNLFTILGNLYPGALLSHRSALEFQPTSTGNVFLTYTYTRKVKLPGITLRFMEGHGPLQGDNLLAGQLSASQLERALLENLQVSRQRGPDSKNLSLSEIENRVEQVIRVQGEKALNELRDNARLIADQLDMNTEFKKLNEIIGALLSTHPSKVLSSPLAIARAFGYPYDPGRISLFEKLFVYLQQREFKKRPDKNTGETAFKSFAFFEAYFSNYIEGTEFILEDARKIIETGIAIPNRHEDSHDVLGTYNLVSNKTEMAITPLNPQDLFSILQYRHSILLSARKTKNPGQFKLENNRAGETFFVDYELVKGTLIKGFDFYLALSAPFSKAAFIMFLVSEVHPFLDGNGRLARIMMNAELVKNEQSRIIIPTVYRDDYMGALRRLTRQQDPDSYIRMLERAHEFSETIYGLQPDVIQERLERSNAFKEHNQAKLLIIP